MKLLKKLLIVTSVSGALMSPMAIVACNNDKPGSKVVVTGEVNDQENGGNTTTTTTTTITTDTESNTDSKYMSQENKQAYYERNNRLIIAFEKMIENLNKFEPTAKGTQTDLDYVKRCYQDYVQSLKDQNVAYQSSTYLKTEEDQWEAKRQAISDRYGKKSMGYLIRSQKIDVKTEYAAEAEDLKYEIDWSV